jgi:hypothetical protein
MESRAYSKARFRRSKEASTDETHKEVQTLMLSGGQFYVIFVSVF